jgi:hypothetical protein
MPAKASKGGRSGSGVVSLTWNDTDGIIEAQGSRSFNFSGGDFPLNTGETCGRDVA